MIRVDSMLYIFAGVRIVRPIILGIAFAIAALPYGLGQSKGPVFVRGEVEELKGVSKVFVSLDRPDPISRDRIIMTIRERAPQLTFVSTQEEADVWLLFATSRVTEMNRRIPSLSEQQTGTAGLTYESAQVASGKVILVQKGDHPDLKLVGRFWRKGNDKKGLCKAFAKEFIRMYLKANFGKTSSPYPSRAKTDPPRLNKNGDAAQVFDGGQAQATSLGGQQGEREDDVVRVDTTFVTIPATVMGRDGKYITNLRKDDFHVYEDGAEQDISFFGAVDEPFNIAIVIDTSASTRIVLKDIVDAANAFVDQLRPDDQLIVTSFDLEIRELVKASKVREVRNRGISIPAKGGSTRLYDAVDFALNELKHMPGRKAMVLLTDGVDGTSITSHDRSLRDVEESDILIYPVQFNTYEDTIKQMKVTMPGVPLPTNQIRKDYERAHKYLSSLAQLTGGRFHQADGIIDLVQAFTLVVGELSRQYTLGYYPRTPPQEGRRRQIKVSVRLPNLTVRARDSYIMASPGAGQTPRK